jgi:hypothetical protein
LVLNAAGSPPFMTSHRVVVVRDVGALTAGDAQGLVQYLADPLDTTVLVFVAGGGKAIPPALAQQLKEVGADERAPDSEQTNEVLKSAAHEAGLPAEYRRRSITAHSATTPGASSRYRRARRRVRRRRAARSRRRSHLGDAGGCRRTSTRSSPAIHQRSRLHRLLTAESAQPKPMHQHK